MTPETYRSLYSQGPAYVLIGVAFFFFLRYWWPDYKLQRDQKRADANAKDIRQYEFYTILMEKNERRADERTAAITQAIESGAKSQMALSHRMKQMIGIVLAYAKRGGHQPGDLMEEASAISGENFTQADFDDTEPPQYTEPKTTHPPRKYGLP